MLIKLPSKIFVTFLMLSNYIDLFIKFDQFNVSKSIFLKNYDKIPVVFNFNSTLPS